MAQENENTKLSLRQKIGLSLMVGMRTKELPKDIMRSILPFNVITNLPVWTDWNVENAINQGFKASSFVYACIAKIGKAASSVPWVVKRQLDDDTFETDKKHDLNRLLKRPNPFMSWQDLIEIKTIYLNLCGNGLWYKNRVGITGSNPKGSIQELWPMFPDKIKPVLDENNYIDHYEATLTAIRTRYENRDILHVMFYDPSNLTWGFSPLQAGAKTVDTDTEAINWNKVALQNRAITDGVFSFKEELTKTQYEKAKDMIREQHQGTKNARMPWVLGSSAHWEQMSLSPAEMDYIESRKMTREEICSIFQVPPPLVGIYENATLANIETARKIFWLDTIIPYLNDLKSAFNMGLASEYSDDVILDFDLSNVQAIQENFKDKIDTAGKLFAMGIPFNQINKRLELGFDDIESGDIGFLPTSILPTSMITVPIDSGSDIIVDQSKGLKPEDIKELY